MSQRSPRVRDNGFWKGLDYVWANTLANQEAENRAAIRLLGGRLWDLRGEELLDAIVEELNAFADCATEQEYTSFKAQLAEQSAIEGRSIPYSDAYPTWVVSLMQTFPLWEVTEQAGAFFILVAGFDTVREFQYLLDVFQEAINTLSFVKRPQIDRTTDWVREQLLRLEQQPAPAEATIPTAPDSEQLQWLGSKVEFTELAYALIEAGYVKASSRAKAVATLANFFGVPDLGKPERALQIVKKRRERDSQPVTPMLDKLKESLKQYLKKKQL
jgi:hypothetical protein